MTDHDLPPLVAAAVLADRAATALQCAGPAPPLPSVLLGRTLFALLYAGAVEGTGRWIRPAAVVRMGEAQAADLDPASRLAWSGAPPRATGRSWYAENTRESVRATLRALRSAGAVVERPGLPETSAAPRWALGRAFAELLTCEPDHVPAAIAAWAAARVVPADPARQRLLLILGRAATAARRFVSTTDCPEALECALTAAASAADEARALLGNPRSSRETATDNP